MRPKVASPLRACPRGRYGWNWLPRGLPPAIQAIKKKPGPAIPRFHRRDQREKQFDPPGLTGYFALVKVNLNLLLASALLNRAVVGF